MMRLKFIAAAILTASAHSAVLAEQVPRSGGFDARVQTVEYNPLNVVRLIGTSTNSTQVIFAVGEEITQIAVGDADAWLVQPAGHLLFVKPIELKPETNMQVVTKRADGQVRSYQFGLIAKPRGRDGESEAIYAVSFAYPTDERDARRAAAAAQAAAQRASAAMEQLSNSHKEGTRNWRYIAQGSTVIEPTEVSDNGRQTMFRFPQSMRLPTIYALAPDSSEMIVPYTVVDDVAVVQATARIFVLRDGQEVLRIVNQGFDAAALPAPAEASAAPPDRIVKNPSP